MNLKKLNWQIWAGFLLALLGSLSYIFLFVNYPITRDFPWANLLLFAIALVFLVVGLRRAFASDRPRPLLSRIGGSVLATLSLAIMGLFIFSILVMARWLPSSSGAPHVGQKAPDFSLQDSNGNQVTLSSLLATPINGKAPKGVLLIFYRGYW
ncbi:MAG TPA: hypothetical protein VIB00_11750 [Pyrinomonadaceae bacterium]|jgi:hypothetical protein